MLLPTNGLQTNKMWKSKTTINMNAKKSLTNKTVDSMKKYLFFLAAALLTACSNDDGNIEQQEQPSQKIGFTTLAQKATRGENSDATNTAGLEAYHQNFLVWGYKTIIDTPATVFEGTQVTFQAPENEGDEGTWTYSPARYWDKSASGYNFYAAAPYSTEWTWDESTNKFAYADFAVTGATLAPSATVNNAAVFTTDTDLMISDDISNHTDYTGNPVNFKFNHILSRINIGVAKGTALESDNVQLLGITLYNMKKNGSFDESLSSGEALQNGTSARWTDASAPEKFVEGVGYNTQTAVTTSLNYIYQALCIPQIAGYVPCRLDGKDLTSDADAYLNVQYTINGEKYNHFYNLADIFNGNSDTDLSFNEGWQYTLKMTINPTLIQFDAEVYEWAEKSASAFDI